MAEGSRLDLSFHQVGRIHVLYTQLSAISCQQFRYLLNYSSVARSRGDRLVLVARAEWSHPFPCRTR